MRMRSSIISGILFLAYFNTSLADSSVKDPWAHMPYHLGQGITFPHIGLNIGGYISLRYEDVKDRDWRIGAKDLSLFFSENFSNRWQFFSEVEVGQALDISSNGVSDKDSEFDLERIYTDYRATKEITFRFGKFLTPVGHWNLIHADPLVWTVDRPLTTAAPFARHATGVMLYGSFSALHNDWDYNLFVDDSDLLDPAQQKELAFENGDTKISPHNAFKRAEGAHISFHFMGDSANIGASYLHYEMYDLRERKELYGLDALWSYNRIEISGEWITRLSIGNLENNEHGGFIQIVLPLTSHLYFIGRQERYKSALLIPIGTVTSTGLTYRPHPAIAVKLEYRDGHHNEVLMPSGWLGSLAVLF